MATITLLNTSTYILNEGSRCRVTKSSTAYYTQGDTFTGTSFECLVWRNADVAVGKTSGVYLGTNSVALATSNTGNNLSYTYQTGNVSRIEIQFVDAFTAGSAGWQFQSIKILPYPKITYSVPAGVTAPATQEVKTGNTLSSANLPTVSLAGYVFDGWYYDSNFTNKAHDTDTITQAEDFTLYANFLPSLMGTSIKSISIPEGDVISISAGGVVLWEAGKRLTSITLSGYNSTLNIDTTFIYGGTVTANYSDGTTANVTANTTFSGYDMSTAGTQTVTASYTENGRTKTATYQLTIADVRWRTIWSGNMSSTSSEFASTASGTGTTPRIRVTFSSISASGNSVGYTVNGSSQSTKPTSPITVTLGSANNLVVLSSSGSSQYDYASATLKKVNKSSDHVAFSFEYSRNDPYGMNISSAYLNITKIEQYY